MNLETSIKSVKHVIVAILLLATCVGAVQADELAEESKANDPKLRAMKMEFPSAMFLATDIPKIVKLTDPNPEWKHHGPGSALAAINKSAEELKESSKASRLLEIHFFTLDDLPKAKEKFKVRFMHDDERVPKRIDADTLACIVITKHLPQNRIYTSAFHSKRIGNEYKLFYFDDEP